MLVNKLILKVVRGTMVRPIYTISTIPHHVLKSTFFISMGLEFYFLHYLLSRGKSKLAYMILYLHLVCIDNNKVFEMICKMHLMNELILDRGYI